MARVRRFLRKLVEQKQARKELGFISWLRYRLLRRKLDRAPHSTIIALTARHEQWPILCRARTSDVHAFYLIFVGREYACLDGLDTQMMGLIVDCGANAGHSAAYLMTRFPNCHLIAVEPDPENFAILQRNIEPYGLRAAAIQAAVWSHPTPLTLRSNLHRTGNEWGQAVRECEPGEAAAFPAVSIGQILKQSGFDRIAILKMDIEGAEAVVFSGDYDDWLALVDHLVIELHYVSQFGSTHARFERAMEGRGFVMEHAGELTYCRRVSPPAVAVRSTTSDTPDRLLEEAARLRAENGRLRKCLSDLLQAYRSERGADVGENAVMERADRELGGVDSISVTS
jgi:FkbM family methyltransferase